MCSHVCTCVKTYIGLCQSAVVHRLGKHRRFVDVFNVDGENIILLEGIVKVILADVTRVHEGVRHFALRGLHNLSV